MQKLSRLSKNLLYWSTITLLIFIPLYFKFPLFGISGSFVSIRLEDILILISFFVFVTYILLNGKVSKLINNKIFIAVILFLGIGLLSVYSASFITHTVNLKLALLHWARRVEYLILFFVGYYSISNERESKVIMSVVFGVLILVIFYAFGQQYLNFPSISTNNSELSKGVITYVSPGSRINSTFAGHYDLAIYLMMAISVLTAICVFTFEKVSKNINNINIFRFLLSFVTLGFSFITLVLTAARLSFFSVIIGIMSALFLIGKKKYIVLTIFVFMLAVLYPSQLRDRFVSTIRVSILQNFESYSALSQDQKTRSLLNIQTLPADQKKETLEEQNIPDIVPGEPTDDIELGVFRSMNIRTKIEWPRAIRAVIKNPFLGTGYSSIGLATDNDYLRALGEVGFLGFIAFIYVLIALAKSLLNIFKKAKGFYKYLIAGTIAMFMAFLVNGLLIDVFEASKVATLFWLICGIVLKLGEIKYDKDK